MRRRAILKRLSLILDRRTSTVCVCVCACERKKKNAHKSCNNKFYIDYITDIFVHACTRTRTHTCRYTHACTHTHTHTHTHAHKHTHTHSISLFLLRGHMRVIVATVTLILHIELTTFIPNNTNTYTCNHMKDDYM